MAGSRAMSVGAMSWSVGRSRAPWTPRDASRSWPPEKYSATSSSAHASSTREASSEERAPSMPRNQRPPPFRLGSAWRPAPPPDPSGFIRSSGSGVVRALLVLVDTYYRRAAQRSGPVHRQRALPRAGADARPGRPRGGACRGGRFAGRPDAPARRKAVARSPAPSRSSWYAGRLLHLFWLGPAAPSQPLPDAQPPRPRAGQLARRHCALDSAQAVAGLEIRRLRLARLPVDPRRLLLQRGAGGREHHSDSGPRWLQHPRRALSAALREVLLQGRREPANHPAGRRPRRHLCSVCASQLQSLRRPLRSSRARTPGWQLPPHRLLMDTLRALPSG